MSNFQISAEISRPSMDIVRRPVARVDHALSRGVVFGLLVSWIVGLPTISSAEEATLLLDDLSLIEESSEGGGAVYTFPEGAHVRLVFGEARDGVLPVTIPVGGLELGVAREKSGNRPALTFRLGWPAQGSLTINSEGAGVLQVDAIVVVQDEALTQAMRYDVQLTTELAVGPPGHADTQGKGLEIASGRMKLVAAGEIRRERSAPPAAFRSVISGRLEPVPASVLDLVESSK